MIRKFQNYSEEELKDSGITFGKNVVISNDVIIHNPQNLIIGDNVRIDTQCIIIVGKNHYIQLGNNIHISAGCYYYGNAGNIILQDYTCTSARCILYTATDDFTEGYMTNSVVDDKYKKITTGDIIIRRHTVVGCESVIMPGVVLDHATSVGTNSFVNKSTNPFDVIGGTPAKFIKKRKNVYLNI